MHSNEYKHAWYRFINREIKGKIQKFEERKKRLLSKNDARVPRVKVIH